uniref:Glycosyltransferase 8 domain-containing protein 1 n=1 Tax=Stegastes partitus TaxID=144197 RepID=A0A3B5B0Z4_9TELE
MFSFHSSHADTAALCSPAHVTICCPLCLSVNLVILVLLAVAFLIIVQRNLLNLSDFLHKENPDAGLILPFESELSPDLRLESVRKGEEIPVLITAAEDRLGAVVAAMNSVYQNTSLSCHIVWLSKTKLQKIKYKIVIFNPELLNGKISKDPQTQEAAKPLTFARFYLPAYIPEAEKAIYLDDDIIVQGDIQELYEINLKPGHAAAFSDDCDSASAKGIIRGAGNQNNYIGFLDFKKEAIKKLGMRANTCSFNPGVIVANLTEWRNQNVTKQLEHWMELNTQEDLYSKTLAESITTPPLLIVFYKRHSTIDPLWHVRHLGTTGAGNRYSPQFVKAAKLLHWNGHYKPWGRASSFSDVWDKWFIPDPTGKFSPVRRHS